MARISPGTTVTSPGPSVFLSYTRADKEIVLEFYRLLSVDGFKPWLDAIQIVAGQRWEREVERAVRSSDSFVVFLSSNSVDHRGYVQKEISLALDIADREPQDAIYVLPVCLDDSAVPDRLAHLQWVREEEPKNFIGVKYLAIQRALLVRANQLLKKFDVSELPTYPTRDTVKSGLGVEKFLWFADSIKQLKAGRGFHTHWQGGDYLVRGCNPTGETYVGVAHLHLQEETARMEVLIGAHALSYQGTYDGEILKLTGLHDVAYDARWRNGILRGTWGETGYEELIPASPFAQRVEGPNVS